MEVENNTNEKKSISRRSFVKVTTLSLAAATSFILGIPLVGSLASGAKKISDRVFSRLAPVKSIPNSFTPVEKPDKLHFNKIEKDAFLRTEKQEDVWVVKKSDNDLTTFSPICPHLGCRYNWNEEQKLFICPCHNSVFTIDGKVVSGPAPRGLDTLPTKIEDKTLYVLYEKFEVGVPEKIVTGY